ncbi:hypothetical protein GQ43DRAFT_368472 [Delitschia confertaspora ATCC 74209]|uniref:BZIP domain-containing protein n=1 Tax=Delitschia confertaspora ATCC 74209 TaxID=1513339 RepID=A0A9P4JT22_9PLEO|nr:hypothetical protein GQ43DRAFT_368472 [Delitschia confertaspora ATCC 74209]
MAGQRHHPNLATQPVLTYPADLQSNNSFDMNLGAGLGPAYCNEQYVDYSMSAFTAINPASLAAGSQTVSPKDIFNDPLASAPPSTAFTNLTSPDVDNSPYTPDGFDTSPMFPDGEFVNSNGWFPLFPEDTKPELPAPAALALESSFSGESMTRSFSTSTNSPLILDSAPRRNSSISGSPAPSGISKPRRRKGPLPPIAVDPTDKVALKRARNTLAARDSRQRKFDHVQSLEKQLAEANAQAEKWKRLALSLGAVDDGN